jgi:ribosomal-protein-alanine N-acetyltransferase
MEIVQLSQDNLDGVYEIEKTCFSNPWRKEDLARQIELATSHFIVAEIDGKVAGYMGLQIFEFEGYVTNIAVLPEYRRQGIAKTLIEQELKNPMDFISLEVRQSNIPAINLYTKMGFDNMGVRPKFYSNPDENAIIMTKYINK